MGMPLAKLIRFTLRPPASAPLTLYSYARMIVDETWGAPQVRIASIEFRPALGGTQAASVPIFSTESSNITTASNAFNSSSTNVWASALGDATPYIGCNFTSPSAVLQVAVRYSNEEADMYESAPRTMRFQVSNNGTSWTTLLTVTNAPDWTAGEQRLYNMP